MPQWQDVDERAQANLFGALRRGAEEAAGTGAFGKTHVEVVLGDKVKVHAGLIGEFQNFEMIFVQVDVRARRVVVLLHVIEQSEFHEVVLT
jgi:hypothetical protein